MPQARFLEFVTREAQRFPGFHLIMGAAVDDLIEEDGVVTGVRYRAPDGQHVSSCAAHGWLRWALFQIAQIVGPGRHCHRNLVDDRRVVAAFDAETR